VVGTGLSYFERRLGLRLGRLGLALDSVRVFDDPVE
jgi:hypothetical protein